MAALVLGVTLGSIPLQEVAAPGLRTWTLAGSVGPAQITRHFVLGDSTCLQNHHHIQAGPHTRRNRTTYTDTVRFGHGIAVPISFTCATHDALSFAALTALARASGATAWGICRNRLYMDHLPSVCRRSTPLKTQCAPYPSFDCNVSLTATQHTADPACSPVRLSDTTAPLPCNQACGTEACTILGPKSVLSVPQQHGAVLYNTVTGATAVHPAAADEYDVMHDTGQLLSTFVLLAATAVWAPSAARLSTGGTTAVWQFAGNHAAVLADAVTFAAGTKYLHLIRDDLAFRPTSLVDLIGDEPSQLYCWAYVTAATALAVAVQYILAVVYVSDADAQARAASLLRRVGVTGVGAAHRRPWLIALRWLLETVLLTSLHVTLPASFGSNFVRSAGATLGVVLLFVTGRDAASVVHAITRVRAAVVMALAAVILFHASVFMIMPFVASQTETQSSAALHISISASVQVLAAGAAHTYPRAMP